MYPAGELNALCITPCERIVYLSTVPARNDPPNHSCAGPIRVLHIPVKDHDGAPITRYLAAAAQFIHQARCTGGTVYVHCSQGRSRSSALTVAYLMASQALQVPSPAELHFVSNSMYSPN